LDPSLFGINAPNDIGAAANTLPSSETAAFESNTFEFMTSLMSSSIQLISPTSDTEGVASFQFFFRTKAQARHFESNIKESLGARRRKGRNLLQASCQEGEQIFGGICLDISTSFFQVYTHSLATTEMPLEVKPVGLEIDAISFDHSCGNSGCWVFDVTYGIGQDNWNVFYLPRAENPDHATSSTDFDYSTITYQWGWENQDLPTKFYLGEMTAEDTFLQPQFPCRSYAYDNPAVDNKPPPRSLTACCIKPFLDMYRPVAGFVTAMNELPVVNDYDDACNDYDSEFHPIYGGPPRFLGSEMDSDVWTLGTSAYRYNKSASYIGGPSQGSFSTTGQFHGMSSSWVENLGIVDLVTLVNRGRIYVDEIEMRSKAGMLTGEPSVEYQIETFIGLAEFRPTNTHILDVATKQIKVTLDKTNFFTVSTVAENDYTFLAYVNLRLVEVYNEDTVRQEFGDALEDRTSRTSSAGAAQYLQVTFTLNSPNFQPDTWETGSPKIIPLNSVRIGKGTFFEEDDMHHACVEFTAPTAGNSVFTSQQDVSDFQDLIAQDCAPNTNMCANPTSIPDSFVSFNIPLGIDWLPGAADDLSQNVFVDLAITAELSEPQTTAAANDQAEQFKTRLTGNVPVVTGGRNIFCDLVTAKTDLVDVADLDLIIGTARSGAELSRLSIKEDLANSMVNRQSSTRIQSDSIEAGLMTLVLKGKTEFFDVEGRTTASGYGLQLEDVITLHIMEGPWAEDPFEDSDSAVADDVLALVETAPDDNFDTNDNLQTEGYKLNGAFEVKIIRATGTAELHPTTALLEICNFRAKRGASGADGFPSTCIIRRDIQQRAVSAYAHEIKPDGSSADGSFMQTVLGSSDYAADTGDLFASTIVDKYSMTPANNRYLRAFWVNPGYEWAPSLTGSRPIFSLSQKLFLFALVRLDEQYGSGRRRVLLQAQGDGSSGVGGDVVVFSSSRASVIADALDLPLENVRALSLSKRVSDFQACKTTEALRRELWSEVKRDIIAVSSALDDVVFVDFSVDLGDVLCGRRELSSGAGLTNEFDGGAMAHVEVLVAFSEAEKPDWDLYALANIPGYLRLEQRDGSEPIVPQAPKTSFAVGSGGPADGSADGSKVAQLVTGLVGAAFVCLVPPLVFLAVRHLRVQKARARRITTEQPPAAAMLGGPRGSQTLSATHSQTSLKDDLLRQLHDDDDTPGTAGRHFGNPRPSPTMPPSVAGTLVRGHQEGSAARKEIAF
jgi:hypothetical protein